MYHEHFTWPQQSGVEMQSDGGVVVGTLQLSVLKKYYRRVLLSAHLKWFIKMVQATLMHWAEKEPLILTCTSYDTLQCRKKSWRHCSTIFNGRSRGLTYTVETKMWVDGEVKEKMDHDYKVFMNQSKVQSEIIFCLFVKAVALCFKFC